MASAKAGIALMTLKSVLEYESRRHENNKDFEEFWIGFQILILDS